MGTAGAADGAPIGAADGGAVGAAAEAPAGAEAVVGAAAGAPESDFLQAEATGRNNKRHTARTVEQVIFSSGIVLRALASSVFR